jgi:hypothetical protein
MEKVDRESEGMEVVLWGEGLGMWKEVLLRLEMMRKRLSGCDYAVSKMEWKVEGWKTYGYGDFGCCVAIRHDEVAIGGAVVDLTEPHAARRGIRDCE